MFSLHRMLWGGRHYDLVTPVRPNSPPSDKQGNPILDKQGKPVARGFKIEATPPGQLESNFRQLANEMRMHKSGPKGHQQPVESVLRTQYFVTNRGKNAMGITPHPDNAKPRAGPKQLPATDPGHWTRQKQTFYLPPSFPGQDTMPPFFNDGRTLREYLRSVGVTTKTHLMKETELLQDCFLHEVDMDEVVILRRILLCMHELED